MRLHLGFRIALLALAALMAAGCATIDSKIKQAGANTGIGFAEKHILPPILTDDDIQMGCIDGQAFGPLIDALGPTGLGGNNDRIDTLIYSTAAICAEQAALDAELRSLRASRQNQVEEAVDARIVQKRWLAVASRRQYHAWQSFEHYYTTRDGIEVGATCPRLHDDLDELVFMLGAISGLQAIVNDVSSQNAVGVPQDIAAHAERAMTCLDSDKWWGVPMAIRAAVWNLMPGGGPADPWVTLQASMKTGREKGVRAAYAIYAISAFAKGDDARLRDAFRQYQATIDDPAFTPSVRYRIFDKVGDLLMWGIADRYWSEHTGNRTPAGSLGHFWDDPQPQSTLDVQDLLGPSP